jgi:S-layer protein (TIGR01567 family)
MKIKKKPGSIVLALTTLVLFLILVSSTVSAASVQNSAARGQYADISDENSNIASVTIERPYTAAFPINDNVGARSPVYDGSNIDDIIDTYGDGTTLTIDATQFAAFYYNIDDNVKTESLSIRDVAGTAGNVIGEGGIVYQTTIQATNYKFEDWGMYPVIGFFAEQYIPINPDRADKLTKLVLDSDDKYSIRTGELLDLGKGYAIEVKQIDVAGNKIWLEFTKGGEYVDDEIISVVDNGTNTWEVELDGIQGEYGVVVLRVHVNQILKDAVGSIAQIEGVWLIDYANAMTIESDDEFGKLNDVSINGDTLFITNEDTFTLTRNSDQEIAEGMFFKVADTPVNELRFYVFKQITDPGTYEIRGQIVSGTGDFTWDASKFAGFYYDLNDDVSTESLKVFGVSGNVIPEDGLVYSTTIKTLDYEYSNTTTGWDMYPVISFFGEQYIPINPYRADKLAKLVLDSDDKYTIRTGEILDLGQGYVIEVKQIDIDGERVWFEFTKDGEYIDDEIISIVSGSNNTWEVELDGIQGENDVVVLRIHANQVFHGEVDNIAQIEGIWLIDYINATTINSDDEFGVLNDVFINGDTLRISNEDTFTLTRGSEEEIGHDIFFKVADTSVSELRYYPFVEKVIGENNSKLLPVADFSTNVTSGCAPLSVLFTDISQNAMSRSWDVNNDGVEDSSEASFAYVYTSAGTYTAKLTAINENGTNTKTTLITVEGIPINDKVEIRSPVFDGSDIDDIIDTYGDGTTLTIDATKFAAFYYNIDDNVKTESFSIRDVAGTAGNVIGEGGIVYQTTIQATNYKFEDWDMYPIVCFFGEQYIPLNPDKADKLAKLVLDSDDKYSIRTDEILDLGQGYAIEIKQVDIDGNKVWLEFTRNGEYIDDEIISVVSGSDNTWEVELDGIQSEYGVVVLRVHVNQIFKDAVGSIAQIEGVWLIDYVNAMTIESDDEFGKLNDVRINGDTLFITNEDTFTLTRNSDQEIAQGLYFRVADTSSNVLRFYVFKKITDPGTYEIRGQVASGTGNFEWDATNFAGFYYDLNDDVSTEFLKVSGMSGNVIPESGLVYETTVEMVNYEYFKPSVSWDQYPVMGFFGEQYIPINPDKADKFAKLVLDSDDKYTIRTGEQLDLGEGYTIEAKQVDVDGEKVWLEFSKDGEFVDDEIISVVSGSNSTWEVELDGIQGENDVVVLKLHANQVFQSEADNIVQIQGIWLIDYTNATTIISDDEFGVLNDVSINGNTFRISNEDTFTLTRGSEEEIGHDIFFKIADTPVSELRYYLFVEKIIGENNSKLLPVADFSTNVTSGCAPLSVLFTDLSQNALSRSWDFGDRCTSTEQNPTHTYSAAGTYTVTLTVGNADRTAYKTATITVLQESSSNGGSSGGSSHSSGGGGGSPEPARNVEVKELSQVFITNGKAIQFDFTKNATCVVYVGFDAKKTAGKTTTIVEQLKNKSTLVSGLPSDEVYKFFNIWVGNGGFASSENIENPVIGFRVEKAWLPDKKIDQSSIALNRYSNKTWEQLPASLLSEDEEYLYFTAKTPGFSPFAITGKANTSQEGTATEIQPENESDSSEENKKYTGSEADQEPEQGESTGMPGFEIVYGVAGLLSVFHYIRK